MSKVGKFHSYPIDNVYYCKCLKHNLLGVSQICDIGNHVVFTPAKCMVTNENFGNLVQNEKGTEMLINLILCLYLKMNYHVLVLSLMIPLCGIKY